MTTSASDTDDESEDIRAHIAEIEDGCGCTEVWEYLSETREENE
jgi:hypothetical protein